MSLLTAPGCKLKVIAPDAESLTAGSSGSSGGPANLPPVIVPASHRIYPLDGVDEPLVQGTSYVLTSTATDPEGNTPITWSCTYTTPGMDASDPNAVASATPCASLASLGTTNGVLVTTTASFSNGVLTWRPTYSQRGTYAILLTATDSLGNSASQTIYLTVREGFTASKLLSALDPASSRALPGLASAAGSCRVDGSSDDNLTAWLNLVDAAFNANLSGISAAPWAGNGTATSPYSLGFNGTSDSFAQTGALGASTKIRLSAWVNPGAPVASNSVILANSSGSDGFVLRQSAYGPMNEIVLQTGASNISTYHEAVLADSPVGYWTLDEPQGITQSLTAVKDVSGANRCSGSPCDLAVFAGTNNYPDFGHPSATSLTGLAPEFNGIQNGIGTWDHAGSYYFSDGAGNDQAFSIDAWIYLDPAFSSDGVVAGAHFATSTTRGYYLGVTAAKKLDFRIMNQTGVTQRIGRLYNTALSTGTWYHVGVSYDGSKTAAGIRLYLNGLRVDDTDDSAGSYDGVRSIIGFGIGNDTSGNMGFNGLVDEVAVYPAVISQSHLLLHYLTAIQNSPKLAVIPRVAIGDWLQVSYDFDGAAAHLYGNGILSGSFVSPGGGFSPNPAVSMSIGSGPGHWKGQLADLRIYGTSDGTSPGAKPETAQDFEATANRFRRSTVENIYTTGLNLHLDAALADRGLRPFPATVGCDGKFLWQDLSGNGLTARLDGEYGWSYGGWHDCVAEGWVGNGTPASPYALNIDNVEGIEYVNLGSPSQLVFNDGAGTDFPFSVEVWAYVRSFGNGPDFLCKQLSNSREYCFWGLTSRRPIFEVDTSTGNYIARSGDVLSTNTWYHLVATYDGTKTETGIKIYINGNESSAYASASTGTYTGMTVTGAPAYLGNWGGSSSANDNLDGKIAIARVYAGALTLQQVRQNCHAQKARFGAVCGGP